MKYWLGVGAVFLMMWTGISEGQAPKVLTGTVQDTTGAVIRGAKIRVLALAGKTVTQGETDGAGGFRFANLKDGSYILDVTDPGFRESKRQISISGNAQSPILISLVVAGDDEQITVGGADSSTVTTEIDQNKNGQAFDGDTLDRLPVFDHDYITTLSRFLNPDSTGTNGVTLVVNGVEANGPGVTASAISSVKINHNPYTALFSRPGRARIELTTEGGTPQFHGTANFLYRDSLFDARNPFALVKAGEQRTYYEGSLTGPLSRNKKTNFLLSLDRDNDNQEAVVDAYLPSGELRETFRTQRAITFFPGESSTTTLPVTSCGSATPSSTKPCRTLA